MRTLISSIFVLTSLITLGQNPNLEDLWKLYQSQHYEKVIELAKPHLADEALKLDLNLLLGRTYTDKGDFRLAIPFLEYTVENDPEKSWRQAWALGYLGTSHFMLQNYDESETFIKKCTIQYPGSANPRSRSNISLASSLDCQTKKSIFLGNPLSKNAFMF